jgi:hypothetical protein
VPFAQDVLNFLGVLVRGPAHHPETQRIFTFAVVSSVESVLTVDPIKVNLYEELRQIRNPSLPGQKISDAIHVKEALET